MTAACQCDRDGLDRLLAHLRETGHQLIGPRVSDGAIVYDRIDSTADLPEGWTDEQEAGRYRLQRRDDQALFGYVVGPQSWKKYLFPAETRLWRAERGEDGIRFLPTPAPTQRHAFIGVRPCELAAIGIQDRVFTGGVHIDERYAALRAGVFIVAVNCTEAAPTCFCPSMDTGPRSRGGHDIAITELIDGQRHGFLLEAGSKAGEAVLASLGFAGADETTQAAARAASERAAAQAGRHMPVEGLREALLTQPESPLWDEIAERCLSCANCTLACPTCFCHTIEDSSDLSGDHAERWQRWDSCFTREFSYVHGGAIRPSSASRYRQWLTHKLATWWDQFDSSGCVGCGRCITWCPVGIDITREAARFQAAASQEHDP
jgi:sulfhydrogenase subunit beta (sulfur reductase)